MSRMVRLAMMLSLGVVAAACGNGDARTPGDDAAGGTAPAIDAEPVGRFVFSRSMCTYEGPGTIPEGEASFALASRGGTADFDLWKLDGGHEYEELVAHIQEEVRRSEGGLPGLGHPTFATLHAEASTDAEGVGTLTASVEAGVYGMACIRFGRDGAFVTAGPIVVD